MNLRNLLPLAALLLAPALARADEAPQGGIPGLRGTLAGDEIGRPAPRVIAAQTEAFLADDDACAQAAPATFTDIVYEQGRKLMSFQSGRRDGRVRTTDGSVFYPGPADVLTFLCDGTRENPWQYKSLLRYTAILGWKHESEARCGGDNMTIGGQTYYAPVRCVPAPGN